MNTKNWSVTRFITDIGTGQSYLNLIYILIAFPLGIFYFVFLVTGVAAGASLMIVWVGLPILVLVGIGWWFLAHFERMLAIYWLKEKVPPMTPQSMVGMDIWSRSVAHLKNPVTWKSFIYLLIKFPLGMATFVILFALISLTVAFLVMPIVYEYMPGFQMGLFFGPGIPPWEIDSLGEAFIGLVIGLVLWPVTIQVANGLAWIHAKFARMMLSMDPMA
jgi:hypothetical protein